MLSKMIPVVMKTTIVLAAAAMGAGYAFATAFSLNVVATLARLPMPQWTQWAIIGGAVVFVALAIRARTRLYPPVGRFAVG